MRYLKWIALGLFILVLTLTGSIIYLLGVKDGNDTTKVEYSIVAGTSRSQIADDLAQKGLIKSSFAFYIYTKLTHKNILPGTYEVSSSMSATEIADTIDAGRFKTIKITIIEGWRAKDIEKYLVEDRNLKQMEGFTQAGEKYEGYLFPDTYTIKKDETIDGLITIMRDDFDKRTSDLKINQEVIILASIVEREAASDEDRPGIASVYINRINKGMRLEADPTIQYAKGNWKAVTLSDYKNVISPYNTYLNDGLPPGPICNPGLASIKAVLSPANSDYLYFFHAKGQTYYSTTLAEHQAKVKQYFQ